MAERRAPRPYQPRKAAPPQAAAAPSVGLAATRVPTPDTPRPSSIPSHRMQTRTTARMWLRRTAWVRTKAFCAPMATISPPPMANP